jgi:hypothetical protein
VPDDALSAFDPKRTLTGLKSRSAAIWSYRPEGGEGFPQRRALVGSGETFSLNANIGVHLGCRAFECVAQAFARL